MVVFDAGGTVVNREISNAPTRPAALIVVATQTLRNFLRVNRVGKKTFLRTLIYPLFTETKKATIIQCYSAVLALFEKSGMHQEESLTPRELEAEVSARLGFSSENLHQLTALFERARYSAEELSSQEAERALFYFKQLSEELESREQSRKNAMMSVQTEQLALTKI